jgi:hypothetical protein
MRRRPAADVDWDNCQIGLSEIARVVNSEYDVADWLKHPGLDWPSEFETPRGLLVWRTGDKIAVRELSAFSALVMREIQRGTTFAALVRSVQQRLRRLTIFASKSWLSTRSRQHTPQD